MPTYEYECNKCGERFDVFQSFAEEPLTKHPGKCRGKVVKVMSPAGIVFSGSGFYKTDNRTSAKNGSSKPTKDSGASKTETSASSSSSDSGSSGSKSSDKGSSKPTPASSSSSS